MRTIIWFIYFWLYLLLMLPEYWKVKSWNRKANGRNMTKR